MAGGGERGPSCLSSSLALTLTDSTRSGGSCPSQCRKKDLSTRQIGQVLSLLFIEFIPHLVTQGGLQSKTEKAAYKYKTEKILAASGKAKGNRDRPRDNACPGQSPDGGAGALGPLALASKTGAQFK